jgi:hypothetical protein
MNAEQLQNELPNFTGTETWFRHWLRKDITYTEGVQFLAQNAGNGCYWLIDEIVFAQTDRKVKAEEFQVWRLRVQMDKSAKLSCEDGNDNEVYAKIIDFTDFPMEEVTLYFTNNVIHLPSEY